MIRKQARDLCGRDVERMVSTVNRFGRKSVPAPIEEVMHHKRETIVLVRAGSIEQVLTLNPETIVEVTGTHTQAPARDGATMTICDECDVAWPCGEVRGA